MRTISRVASTPFITGMLMSISTTSGACSRTRATCLRAVSRLGDDADALLLEQRAQPGAKEIVVVDEEDLGVVLAVPAVHRRRHGRPGRRRRSSSPPLDRDRHRPCSPGASSFNRGEPDVDPRAADRGAGVGGDCVPVAGDGEVRSERDDGGVDGRDAVADRRPGGGEAGQRVGADDDGERGPAAGAGGRRRGGRRDVRAASSRAAMRRRRGGRVRRLRVRPARRPQSRRTRGAARRRGAGTRALARGARPCGAASRAWAIQARSWSAVRRRLSSPVSASLERRRAEQHFERLGLPRLVERCAGGGRGCGGRRRAAGVPRAAAPRRGPTPRRAPPRGP